MSTEPEPIIVTRSTLAAMLWITQDQVRGGRTDRVPIFHVWRGKLLLGYGGDFITTMQLAERLAAELGTYVDDATLETSSPEDRLQWPHSPPV